MQWFYDVQIFIILVLFVTALNCIIFIVIGGKATTKSVNFFLRNSNSNDDISTASIFVADENGRDSQKRSRVLFVLADFTDLVLYFGPLLFGALRKNCDIMVLNIQPCFGERYYWLKRCATIVCQTVGFSESNVFFVWDERMPHKNTPNETDPWPILSLMNIIEGYAFRFEADFIVTYDGDGINENPARQAINEATRELWRKNMLTTCADIYLLSSVSAVRALAGLLDVPFFCLPTSSQRVMSSLEDVFILQKLFLACEWKSGAYVLKTCFLIIVNRYFLVSKYHCIQEEEKYHLYYT